MNRQVLPEQPNLFKQPPNLDEQSLTAAPKLHLSNPLDNPPVAALIVAPDDLRGVLASMNNLSDDELCLFYRNYVKRLFVQGAYADPVLVDIKRRFKNLSRAKQINGKYLMIDGATSFTKWCKDVAKIARSTANYRLDKTRTNIVKPLAEPKEKKPKKTVTVSDYNPAKVANRIMKYLKLTSSRMSKADNEIVLRSLLANFQEKVDGL